jgi:hypothetical protein
LLLLTLLNVKVKLFLDFFRKLSFFHLPHNDQYHLIWFNALIYLSLNVRNCFAPKTEYCPFRKD